MYSRCCTVSIFISFGQELLNGNGELCVTGEYGGIGKRTPGHEWDPAGSFSAQDPNKSPNETAWLAIYDTMTKKVAQDISLYNVSAAIYTQLTDVEQEINGLLTYDRLSKVSTDSIKTSNDQAYVAL